MGVMKLFSSDSRDCPGTERVIEKMIRVNSTPDPTKFTVKRKEVIRGYPILLINYPDVKNYEGNKILMFPKFFDVGENTRRIDPHFFTNGDSPIARFEPTKFGWEMARILAENLP